MKSTAKSRQDPQPRCSVAIGGWVPSSSRALIVDRGRVAAAQVLEQGEGVGRPGADERARPVVQAADRIGVLLDRRRSEVDPLVVGIQEGVVDRQRRDVEDRPRAGSSSVRAVLSITSRFVMALK